MAFVGDDPADSQYADSEDFSGTLAAQWTQAMGFVQRNLRKVQNGRSFNTTGEWEIPRAVFEELLVNLFVHRNYFIAASPKIFIFRDRVELHSPGALPNMLTVDQVKLGSSISRNPLLQKFASNLLPYRGIGTGIRRAMKLWPRIELVNDSAGNWFRAIIPRVLEAGAVK